MPVRMKFDSENHKMVMMIVFGAMAATVGAVFALAKICGIDLEAFMDKLLITKAYPTFAAVIIASILLLMLSYKLAVKFMEEREF